MRMRRKKIKIKKIEDISARQVTFSKRRQGLVKKASELSILCDAEVAVTVISPAGRLHQYSSCNIKNILDKFLLYSEAEQHQVRSQEEKRNNSSLSRGVEDKINYLRLITSENLQHFSPEELQKLETKLEARLQSVTAKKNTLAAGIIRTQLEKANKSARRIPEANIEGSSFQFSTERWVPPPPNTYKVNFAGANFQDMHASGVGIVIRNWGGVFMAAFARFFPGLMDLNTISLMAAKCAVEFSVDYHFTHIVLEGDDENTVNEVKNTHDTQSLTSNGNLQEVMSYIRQLGGCFLSHVQRSGNDAAHMVAQYARNVGDEIVWLMEEPDFLAHILLADVAQ